VGRFRRDSYHFILCLTLSEADIIATLGIHCCASCGSRGEERCRLKLADACVVERSVLSSLLAGEPPDENCGNRLIQHTSSSTRLIQGGLQLYTIFVGISLPSDGMSVYISCPACSYELVLLMLREA
jgi:hypothetical protein